MRVARSDGGQQLGGERVFASPCQHPEGMKEAMHLLSSFQGSELGARGLSPHRSDDRWRYLDFNPTVFTAITRYLYLAPTFAVLSMNSILTNGAVGVSLYCSP